MYIDTCGHHPGATENNERVSSKRVRCNHLCNCRTTERNEATSATCRKWSCLTERWWWLLFLNLNIGPLKAAADRFEMSREMGNGEGLRIKPQISKNGKSPCSYLWVSVVFSDQEPYCSSLWVLHAIGIKIYMYELNMLAIFPTSRSLTCLSRKIGSWSCAQLL